MNTRNLLYLLLILQLIQLNYFITFLLLPHSVQKFRKIQGITQTNYYTNQPQNRLLTKKFCDAQYV